MRPPCSSERKVEVVPQVAVRQVLPALRFEHVAMMAVRLVEDFHQRMHFRQMRMGRRYARRETRSGREAETGMAIDHDAEAVAEQFAIDQTAQGRLPPPSAAGGTAIPGQARPEAMAADQEGGFPTPPAVHCASGRRRSDWRACAATCRRD
jgi:hypothetical protein